ncbi:RNA-binding cell elongation regulator Jag/EloR [Tepidibacter mesophilus]|uniref:RNA-binding cell elongation regulator Jag/EloR n=1 Tax=Tepidibacter mesophilus TaxID=655607 RepID=UPI000C086438|nr:RNA-binding cell elongation regulator Jag/EloR [Tepidibacter mesophilus]
MRFLEVTGKSIEEALDKALGELNVTKEDVEIDVIEQPSRGFLGIIGNKLAKIKVTLKENPKELARKFVQDILDSMDIESEIKITQNKNEIKIDLTGEDATSLIGKRGYTLDSLQFLTGLVVNKSSDTKMRVLIDIQNYREKREKSLIRYSRKLAKQCAKTRKTIKLESMNPYERRIVHSALQNDRYVNTYSEGIDPNRKVVITIKNK